jgi:glucose/arabinose dehydrogenase
MGQGFNARRPDAAMIFEKAWIVVILSLCPYATVAAQNVEALEDPIPMKIEKGDIVVAAASFLQLPQTQDVNSEGAHPAFARLQYLLPVRDGSGRLMINDTRGLLYVTDSNGAELQVYLDLREQAVGFSDATFANETGLAGFSFHPDFSKPGAPGFGKFYTSFSSPSDHGYANYLDDAAGNHESVIREWTAEDSSANVFTGSSREVFRIGQFDQSHNIGTIKFNPYASVGSADYGILYVSLGDGGGAHDPEENGQSLAAPMSALMRIDPLGGGGIKQYGIPADNPFVGVPEIANEIWVYGLRHTQQFSFDTDGRVFMTDIGQNQVEEINIGVAGGNYGWRVREGMFATAFSFESARPGPVYPRPENDPQEFIYPVAQYDHDEGNAVGSGFVYRGSAIPELQGKYVFADMVRGRLFFIEVEGLSPGEPALIQELRVQFDGVEREFHDVSSYPNAYSPSNRSDLRMGIDSEGELYLLSKGDGRVRKLVPAN